MLLTILLAQSTGQQPGQNTGTTNSGEIVDGAIHGADLIVKSFANDWAELASGTSSIYTAVVAVSMLVAVVLVSFASLGWYRKFAEEGFSYTQTAKALCEKLETSQTDSNGNITNPRQTCIKKGIEKAQSDAREAREKKGTGSGSGSWNPLDIGGELVNSAIQGLVYVILSGLSAGFQYIVQLSFLLVAYVAPIFLVLSLLPFESKPLYAWLSGWLGLTLILISYSIIVGIVASAIVDKPSSNLLLMQLIQAIFSPLLAVAIGTGGGMSVFTAFTSGIKFSVGLRK